METHAFRMQLKPGVEAEYKRRHDEIWPELSAALHAAGIRNYRIFLDPESLHLFGILELTPDNSRERLPTLPIMRKWWDYMADLMLVHDDNRPLEWPLQQVFYLE